MPNKAQAAREPANSTTLFTNETITPKILTDIPTNENSSTKIQKFEFNFILIMNLIIYLNKTSCLFSGLIPSTQQIDIHNYRI